MINEQISKILIDNNTEMLINSSSPLKLKEGYELSIKSINGNETKAILELKKNGQSVDTEIVQPTIVNANMRDQTYYYKTTIGETADIIQIAVHFKNIFHGDNKDSATIDGIFQISDTPTTITLDQQYDKMSIRNVDATDMTITMDNKDNQITLGKNIDVVLMGRTSTSRLPTKMAQTLRHSGTTSTQKRLVNAYNVMASTCWGLIPRTS